MGGWPVLMFSLFGMIDLLILPTVDLGTPVLVATYLMEWLDKRRSTTILWRGSGRGCMPEMVVVGREN